MTNQKNISVILRSETTKNLEKRKLKGDKRTVLLVSKIKSFKILAVGVTQPLVLCVLFSDVIEKILLGDARIRCGAFGEMTVKVFLQSTLYPHILR